MPEKFTNLAVQEVLSRSMRDFESWQEEFNALQTVAIPSHISGVFIPERILELADDPFAVRCEIIPHDISVNNSSSLNFLIIERKKDPISDPDRFESFKRGEIDPQWKEKRTSYYLGTEAPEGIDFRHASHEKLLHSTNINAYDKIYIDYSSSVPKTHPEILQTNSYLDRPDMHGLGIATSFLDRSDEIWKKLGFTYRIGVTWSPNPSFFLKRGVDIRELPDNERKYLSPLYQGYINHGDPVIVKKL